MADQTKRIIYKRPDGGVSVIIPALNETRTIEEIAQKDVPTGLSYKIVILLKSQAIELLEMLGILMKQN